MATAYDAPANRLIAAIAERLKGVPEIKPPAWLAFGKTGSHVERAPQQPDAWYLRCASVLRKVYLRGGVGVARLRTAYGGRKHRGSRPERHRDAGGSAIRKALQQLEKAGLLRQAKGRGRSVTAKGEKLLGDAAKSAAA